MWQIRRVRMEAVGHPDARFDPLNVELLDADDRPTDSVLWLENMGGKTTWVSLLFSVLRPAHGEFLGGLKDTKSLGDYVLASDTAHVIIEWQRLGAPALLAQSGPRLVTGQVLEWKERRVDLDNASTRLQRRFYGFVANRSMDFDRLPVRTPDGRRRSLSDFEDALNRQIEGADAQRPSDHQRNWHAWLDGHGLDSEVFRYQLLMNTDEGAVAEQFHWNDGNAFVKWALPYVTDPKGPDDVLAALRGVRELIGRRDTLALELEFCKQVSATLTQTAAAHARYADACKKFDAALEEAGRLGRQAGAGAASARVRAAAAGETARHLGELASEVNGRAERAGRQRAEALIIAADLKIRELTREIGEAEAEYRIRESADAAWEILPLLVDESRLALELSQVRAELDAHHSETRSVRDAAESATLRFARKLTALREWALEQQQRVKSDAKRARSAAREFEAAAHQHQNSATSAIQEEAAAIARLSALDEEVAAAVSSGLLAERESPAEALARHETADRRATAAVREAREGLVEAQSAASEAERVWGERCAAAFSAESREKSAEARRLSLRQDEAVIRTDSVLMAAAQVETFDPWLSADAVLERLSDNARIAADSRIRVELDAAEDRRAVRHIQREHLLPPSADVERALEALEAVGVRTAFSGWQVLRDRHPLARRSELVELHPDLATGILLRDESDLERAIGALADTALSAPLTLAPVQALSGPVVSDTRRKVLQGPAALYDEALATEEMSRRLFRLDTVDGELAGHQATEEVSRSSAARYRQFLRQWPDTLRDEVDTESRSAVAAREEAARALAEAEVLLAAGRETLSSAQGNLSAAEGREATVRAACERVREIALRVERRPDHLRARDQAASSRHVAEAERAKAVAEQVRLDGIAENAEREASAAERRGSDILATLERCGVSPQQVGPVPEEPPDLLEQAWRAAAEALEGARRDVVLEASKARLDSDIARVRIGLASVPDANRAAARTLMARSSSGSIAERAAERRAVRDALTAATEAVGALRRRLADAEKLGKERARPPKDRCALDEQPSTSDEAELLAGSASTRMTSLSGEANALTARGAESASVATAQAAITGRLERVARNISAELKDYSPPSGELGADVENTDATPWTGSAEDCEAEREAVSRRLRTQAEARSARLEERRKRLGEVDRLVNDIHFGTLVTDGMVRERLLGDADDIRAARAAGFAATFTQRAETIRLDLEQIEEHRSKVTMLLVGQVRSAAHLLQQLENQSRLPEGLDEWSGHRYVTITYPGLPADGKRLSERVSAVIDRACDPKSPMKKDGATLLYEALRAAVGTDFEVEILKPRKVLRNERVAVSEIRAFSGGQKVTAAIVLFAALIRLRELNLHRDHVGPNDAGATLVLDNPIGKASAGTLIEVQRRVAQRCRLQLVYTTGVSDLAALGPFTCIIRLDGRENLRTGAQHVVEVERSVLVNGVRLVQRRPSRAPERAPA